MLHILRASALKDARDDHKILEEDMLVKVTVSTSNGATPDVVKK